MTRPMTAEERIGFAVGMMVFGTSVLLLRFLTRYVFFGRPPVLRKSELFCDGAIFTAWVFSTIILSLDIRHKVWSIEARGSPYIIPTLLVTPDRAKYALQEILFDEYAYLTILWLCKGSFLAMYMGLASALPRYIRTYLWGTVAFTFTSILVLFIMIGLWCQPISRQWTIGPDFCVLGSSVTPSVISFSLHFASDLLILGLSITILHSLNLGRRQRIAMAFVIFVASLTMIAAILRLHFAIQLSSERATSVPIFPGLVFVTSAVECETAMFAASLPALRVLANKWLENARESAGASHGRSGSLSYVKDSVLGRNSDSRPQRLEEYSMDNDSDDYRLRPAYQASNDTLKGNRQHYG